MQDFGQDQEPDYLYIHQVIPINTVLPRIVYRGTLIETKRISKTHFSTLMTCHYS